MEIQALKKIFKRYNQKPVVYYKINAEIMGSVYGGVFLSQIIYWWSQVDGDEFWHRDDDFKNELGLSDWELRTAKNTLKNLGLCQIEPKSLDENNKWYRVNFYRFNFEKYLELIGKLLSEKSLTQENQKIENEWEKCVICNRKIDGKSKIFYGASPEEKICSPECYKEYFYRKRSELKTIKK